MSATVNEKVCVGCDAVVPEFYSLGCHTSPVLTVHWGVCERCYHGAHRTKRTLSRMNTKIRKAIAANPERYRT
jgi:hypothetical protein